MIPVVEPITRVGGQSEVGTLETVLVKPPAAAYLSEARVDDQWRQLGYSRAPRWDAALAEWDRFSELLRSLGIVLCSLPPDDSTCLDSIYVRDASLVCDAGLIMCSMGKAARRAEPGSQERSLISRGLPVHGHIEGEGRLEGGDVVWLDERTVAVGRGYRTNAEGVRQLRRLLTGLADDIIVAHLPHGRGPRDVFHLMSGLSPIDRNLALVYSPVLSVPFRETLLERGIDLVEVPDAEYPGLGCNVLTVAPRRCVMVAGNPITRARLEAAGVEVFEFSGREICLAGSGGPTCLTRPLCRSASPVSGVTG